MLIGLNGARLYADGGGLRFEPCNVDILAGDRQLGPPFIDQPIAQQGIQAADLDLAELIGEIFILLDREIAACITVLAV